MHPADWVVSAYAESLGPGPELKLREETEGRNNVTRNGDRFDWSHTLTVPANSGLVGENPGGGPNAASGIYLLTVTVFMNSNIPGAGFDIIGFNQGPTIKVENPQ
jgi:hypothetical protein